MTITFTALLATLHAWAQTPDGTNTIAAIICMLEILGLPSRLCLLLTLALHIGPILL